MSTDLTNRLMQALQICIDCRVIFLGALSKFWTSYISWFRSYEFFKWRTEWFEKL